MLEEFWRQTSEEFKSKKKTQHYLLFSILK